MKRSILIVDDMETNRELLAEAFRDKYNIIEAENGLESLEKLRIFREDRKGRSRYCRYTS